jgi:protein phosphatase 1B
MGNMLDSPITTKQSETLEFGDISMGASGMQGWRTEMEDKHIMCVIPNTPGFILLAVFDGHGGDGAAIFAESTFLNSLEKTDEWRQFLETNDENPELLGNALVKTFVSLDNSLRRHQENSTDRRKQDCSGCTAVSALITPRYIICANAGDSRCVLGTAGTTKPLSYDHKPNHEVERKRIENAGGSVQWKRVDGDLAVSRAFGDFQYKTRHDLKPQEQKVSCWPDVDIHIRNSAEDEILILACDGVWDALSSEAAVDTVRNIFLKGEIKMDLVSEELIDIALDQGSRDNISAVVARFPAANIGDQSQGGVMALRAARAATRGVADRSF